MRDVKIAKGERLCQFRLFPKMSVLFQTGGNIPGVYCGDSCLTIVEVLKLEGPDRGGFGSTGR